MKNKTMEYWYSVVTAFLFAAAIISRPEISVSDKILTIALISAIPWAACFIARKEKESKEREDSERNGKVPESIK